jgi:dihydropyrimidinase
LVYPRKGSVVVGADADLVIWDPNIEGVISAKTHLHKCDRNIFEGFKTKGGASIVVANGKVQFENGKLNVERGAGRYIPRTAGL